MLETSPQHIRRVDHERETAAVETLLSRVRMGYILFLSFFKKSSFSLVVLSEGEKQTGCWREGNGHCSSKRLPPEEVGGFSSSRLTLTLDVHHQWRGYPSPMLMLARPLEVFHMYRWTDWIPNCSYIRVRHHKSERREKKISAVHHLVDILFQASDFVLIVEQKSFPWFLSDSK